MVPGRLAAPEDVAEIGAAQEGGQDADGDLARQDDPGHRVRPQEEEGPGQGGRRDEEAVVRPDEKAHQVGDYQADEADDARDRDADGAHQGGGDEQDQPDPGRLHAQGIGRALAQGEDVQVPGEEEGDADPQEDEDQGQLDVQPALGDEAAHQPEDDDGHLLVGDVLHEADAGRQDGGDDDPGEDQVVARDLASLPGEPDDRAQGGRGPDKGGQGNGVGPQ